jgi:hypothetical protein
MAGLAGCGSDDPVSPEQLMGEYVLLQVNGSDLPSRTWTSEGMSEEATAGLLVLEPAPTAAPTDMSGGLYSLSLDLRTSLGGGTVETSLSNRGLWTLDGDRLSFETGSPTLALSGNVIEGVVVIEMARVGTPEPAPRLMFTR